MDEGQSRQGQKRVDLFDALRAGPEKFGQPAGGDDSRSGADLASNAIDHAVHERKVAKVQAGLNRRCRGPSNDAFRTPYLDAPEPRRSLEERLRGDGDTGNDHAAGV